MYSFLKLHDISNPHTIKETGPSFFHAHHSLGKRQGCSSFRRRLLSLSELHHAFVPDGRFALPWMLLLVHIANPKLYSSMIMNPPPLTWNIQTPTVRCSSVQPRDFDFRLVARFRVSHDCVPHCCIA